MAFETKDRVDKVLEKLEDRVKSAMLSQVNFIYVEIGVDVEIADVPYLKIALQSRGYRQEKLTWWQRILNQGAYPLFKVSWG